MHLLLGSIKENGFDIEKSIIPISKEGVILNGSHRLACSIKNNVKLVPCIRLKINSPKYDYKFFKFRNVPMDFLDQSVQKLLSLKKEIYAAIVWPSGVKNNMNYEEYIPNIFYKKEINISFNGLKNIISNVYSNEEWLGSLKNGYPGATYKAIPCYSTNKPLTVYFFKPNKNKSVQYIKKDIRDIIRIGKHSIHINDNKDDLQVISNLLLNNNSIHFLDKVNIKKLSNKFLNQIDDFKKFTELNKINSNKIALDGSMILSAFCLRDARDIDYIISNEEIEKTTNLYHKNISNHNDVVEKYYELSIDNIINNSRNYFTFLGVKFISIKLLLGMKCKRNEVKDKIDIKLIKSVFNLNKFSSFYLKLSQRFIYNILRFRNFIIFILIRFRLHKTIKKIYNLIF